MSDLINLKNELNNLSDPEIAKHSQRFFKTGPGQYGQGDQFLGIRVPVLRKIAKKHQNMPLDLVCRLLKSKFHEERLTALIILVNRYKIADQNEKDRIFSIYLDHTTYINNWDLVDVSAHKIVGKHLDGGNRTILRKLARSDSLWERRIAIISTLYFIQINEFSDTLLIADLLLDDKHDLIHKAVGWMLREVGNRNRDIEEQFLWDRYKRMPRTMLRYAIEKFPEEMRQLYLKGHI